MKKFRDLAVGEEFKYGKADPLVLKRAKVHPHSGGMSNCDYYIGGGGYVFAASRDFLEKELYTKTIVTTEVWE